MAKPEPILSKIPCEVKQVNSRKLRSLDVEYKIVLTTADPAVMALGLLPGDVLVDVTVEKQQ